MKTDSYCSQCGQKNTCRAAYAKLGEYDGPSVVWEVLKAFLLPLGVFVISLAAGQRLLRDVLGEKALTAACFGISVCLTAAFIWVLRFICNRSNRKCIR